METKLIGGVVLIYGIFMFIDTFVVKPKTVLIMSNKSGGVVNTLLSIAGIIGGAWITAKLIEKYSKKEVKYSCPNCSSDIDYHQEQCKFCDVKLKWDF